VKFSNPFSRDVGKICIERLEDWEEDEPRGEGNVVVGREEVKRR